MTGLPKHLTTGEVAKLARASRSTIIADVRNGMLRTAYATDFQRGRHILFAESDAIAYAEARRTARTCANCRLYCGRPLVGCCSRCRESYRKRQHRAMESTALAAPPPPPPPAIRPGYPFPGVMVGGVPLPSRLMRAAVEEGLRGGVSFLLAVSDGYARPVALLGPWEVAACEVRRTNEGWQAHLPPMGPTWHPQAREVVGWVASILPERGGV